MKNGFDALLKDPAFLPQGGYVGFGLNREYPVPQGHKGDLGFLIANLKGSDAAIMRTCKGLNLTTSLRVVLEDPDDAYRTIYYVMCDNVPDMDFQIAGPFHRFLRSARGGRMLDTGFLRNEVNEVHDDVVNFDIRPGISVIWVTELSKYTLIRTPYIASHMKLGWPTFTFRFVSLYKLDLTEREKMQVE